MDPRLLRLHHASWRMGLVRAGAARSGRTDPLGRRRDRDDVERLHGRRGALGRVSRAGRTRATRSVTSLIEPDLDSIRRDVVALSEIERSSARAGERQSAQRLEQQLAQRGIHDVEIQSYRYQTSYALAHSVYNA